MNLAPPDSPLGRGLLSTRGDGGPTGRRDRAQDSTTARALPQEPREPANAGPEQETETRRVQVVARWNQWALVRDPMDGSERWIDLERARFARA